MSIIEEIREKLLKHPDVRYESTRESICIYPDTDNGFTVSLVEDQGRYIVAFDGWHEVFQDKEQALRCFAFGLSSGCRLKEVRRGDVAYKWIVEAKEGGQWVEDSITGRYFFPFWKRKEVRYLQNDLIRD
jgi:hypothetical protein